MGGDPLMASELFNLDTQWIRSAASAELEHVRRLGSNQDLIFATANPGAYEALLAIMVGDETGTPVYQVVTNVKSRYTSQSGILTRLRAMRDLGLIEELPGPKKSQVCLAPSDRLLRSLAPILLERQNVGR
jgi:hypothetical protein